MRNKIQNGAIMEYANSGSAIASGDVVVLGDRVGVAVTDIPATTGKGSVDMSGVFELPSDTGTSYAQGDELYWDGTQLTKTATGNTPAGLCFEAKISGGTTAKVMLQPHPKRAAKVVDASSGSAAEINAIRDALIAAGIMKNA